MANAQGQFQLPEISFFDFGDIAGQKVPTNPFNNKGRWSEKVADSIRVRQGNSFAQSLLSTEALPTSAKELGEAIERQSQQSYGLNHLSTFLDAFSF